MRGPWTIPLLVSCPDQCQGAYNDWPTESLTQHFPRCVIRKLPGFTQILGERNSRVGLFCLTPVSESNQGTLKKTRFFPELGLKVGTSDPSPSTLSTKLLPHTIQSSHTMPYLHCNWHMPLRTVQYPL